MKICLISFLTIFFCGQRLWVVGAQQVACGRHRRSTGIPCFDNRVPDKLTVGVGETVALRCIIYNVNFSNVVISWWKEDGITELSLGEHVTERRYQLDRNRYEDWTLVIPKTQLADSGTFICQINLSKLMEKFFYLSVIEGHKSISFPTIDTDFVKDEGVKKIHTNSVSLTGESFSYLGRSVSLECRAHFAFDYQGATVAWYHYGVQQESDPARFVHIAVHWAKNNTLYSTLSISKLESEHSGSWRCMKISGHPREKLDQAVITLAIRPTEDSLAASRVRDENKNSKEAKNKSSPLSVNSTLVHFASIIHTAVNFWITDFTRVGKNLLLFIVLNNLILLFCS